MTEVSELPPLPKGWVWTKVQDISDTTSGGTPSRKDKGFYSGEIPWLKSGELEDNLNINSAEERINQRALDNSSTKIIPKGSLLVAMYGATVGKLGLLSIDTAINQAICAIQPYQNVQAKYLFYYLSSYRKTFLNARKGGAQPNINQEIVKKALVPLAPALEQIRIIYKIEELFSFLEAGTESLRKVQAQLRRYRQALLKYAFEGKLTEQWRELNKDKIEPANLLFQKIKNDPSKRNQWKSPNNINKENLPTIPDGWIWAKLNELGYFIGGGTPSTENPKFWNGHILWVSPKDMKSDFISNSELKITNYAVENSSVNLIPKNSVLIVARSGILKRTLPVSINTEECTVNQDIKVLVPYTKEMSKFIRIMLKGFESNILNNLVKEGTTVHSLKYREFENQLFPIPRIDEQKKIVENVEKYLLSIDKTENAVSRNLVIAEKLRQSILKQAFMGELVSQDPEDEPAEKLLEYIKAERLTNNSKNNQVELSQYVK